MSDNQMTILATMISVSDLGLIDDIYELPSIVKVQQLAVAQSVREDSMVPKKIVFEYYLLLLFIFTFHKSTDMETVI
jgi:hypothetical protein